MRLIVAGSGIVGASCAFEASCLGAEVVLVDAALAGRATAAGAGIICPWSSRVEDQAWYSLACAAARDYPALIARLAALGETDIGYRRVGALALADGEQGRQRIRQALLARRAAAPEIGDVRDVSGAQARRMFPPLRADAVAVYIGGDAVVAVAGAWTGSLLQAAGLTVRVEAQRGQIMHISLGSVDTRSWPVVLPGAGGHCMLAFDDSRIVAGATREAGSGFDYRVTPGAWPRSSGRPSPSPPASPRAPAWKPGSASARWARTSARCWDRCAGWRA